MNGIALGIDLATASARCVAVEVATGRVLTTVDAPLAAPERGPGGMSTQSSTYADIALGLLAQLCGRLGGRTDDVVAVSVTGTSGTVVPCDESGAPVGRARLYDDSTQSGALDRDGLSFAPTLGRVVALQDEYAPRRYASSADVVGAALVGGPVAADTSHFLKAGIDPAAGTWPADAVAALRIPPRALPPLVPPGTPLGVVATDVTARLGLPSGVVVVAGMTDGCTAQVATGAVRVGDTVGVLGTTLVLKAVCARRLETADGAVYSHLAPDGAWWAGGASNSGAGVLADEFPGADLGAIDERVAPRPSTVVRYPLSRAGERFPVADRHLPPLESAAPQSRDDAYRAVLDGVAFVERLGIERLEALGAFAGMDRSARRHVLAGGASVSPVWNRIRASVLAPVSPVAVSGQGSSAVGAAVLAAHGVAGAGTAFGETVDAMVRPPTPVAPDPGQTGALADAYLRFIALVVAATAHPPLQGVPRA